MVNMFVVLAVIGALILGGYYFMKMKTGKKRRRGLTLPLFMESSLRDVFGPLFLRVV